MMKRILLFLLVCCPLLVRSQDAPFWKEITAFKRADSVEAPKKKAIVFVGSSSFRMWRDIDRYFPEHTIINRGFGGSSLPHVIDYADEIIIPYKPKQVVIYCGENDFMSDTVTSEIVVQRFVRLFDLLRSEIPRARILYVSMKPSPRRQHLMPQIAAANAAIRDFLKEKRRSDYVSIWEPMLDEQGAPRKELFLADMLHMNDSGYAIWKKALEHHLR